jgi:sigma-B regulation protein RsbU (phosphoserine phosphatase)
MLVGLASGLLAPFWEAGRTMESELLQILFIGGDESFARAAAEMLDGAGTLVVAPTVDAATAKLSGNHSFHAILIDLPAADKDGLLQVGLLSVKKPRLPIVVFGPVNDEAYATEMVRSGAQDYLSKATLDAHELQHAIRCAVERQLERTSLIEEKDNYYGVFDHLVEGVFRTTPDGHYLLANIALARIYGYDSPVELMASITDIAHGLYVEAGRREEFVQLMQANDTITGFESKVYRKDNTVIWISENCRAVRDADGNILYFEGTVEDITERKYAEEQIRRTTAELSRSREELRAKNLMMEDNLRMAREIQTAMLPQQYPVFPLNVSPTESAFQFTHRYQPAGTVSGDFFSVSALSNSEVGVFICDVAGHGVRAALVTAMIRALAEELKPIARDPGNFLRKLNSDLCAILKSTGSPMLTTAFYFVADWQKGSVRFANAGHPKPLLIRHAARSVEPLANDCGYGQPALGLFDDPPYETSETTISPGDFLMLFTDGLYEVQGANEELYSQQRLLVDVQNHLGEPAGEMFDHLLETIRTFAMNQEFEDDVCLVGMKFAGRPAVKS